MLAFCSGAVFGVCLSVLLEAARINFWLYFSIFCVGYFGALATVEVLFFLYYRHFQRDSKGNKLSFWDYITWREPE